MNKLVAVIVATVALLAFVAIPHVGSVSALPFEGVGPESPTPTPTPTPTPDPTPEPEPAATVAITSQSVKGRTLTLRGSTRSATAKVTIYRASTRHGQARRVGVTTSKSGRWGKRITPARSGVYCARVAGKTSNVVRVGVTTRGDMTTC